MKKIEIKGFIETKFFRVFRNENPISITELNFAFSTNKFYRTGIPDGRHGLHDIYFNTQTMSKEDYSFPFVDTLTKIDRYLVNDRVAFFSIMRAYLPSFTLIDKDKHEYKINSFVSFYENGFFSITNTYNNLALQFEEVNLMLLYQWDNIGFIKLDPIMIELLSLEISSEIDISKISHISYPIEDFLAHIRKFDIGEIVVTTLLRQSQTKPPIIKDSDELTIKSFRDPYSYILMKAKSLKELNPSIITNTLFRRGKTDFVNPNIHDVGIDFSTSNNNLSKGNNQFYYHITTLKDCDGIEEICDMFCFIDSCLLEKVKYIDAIKEINEIIKTEDFSLDNLLNARYKHLTSSKEAVCYEYSDFNMHIIKSIRNALSIADYRNDYNKLCEIVEEITIEHANAKINESERRKQSALNLTTLILTVPSVSVLVDMFYGIEIGPYIYFPINCSKIIWITFTLISSLLFINRDSMKKFLDSKKRKKNDHEIHIFEEQ